MARVVMEGIGALDRYVDAVPSGIGAGTGPAYSSPEPYWDSSAQAYYDAGASGLYSYDGGASWEARRTPQDDYFGNQDFYTDTSVNTYVPPPVSTQGALASMPQYSAPTDRASLIDYGGEAIPNYDEPQNIRARFQDFDLNQPEEPAWWQKGISAVADFGGNVARQAVLNAPVIGPQARFLEEQFDYSPGDAFKDYNDYVGDPLAETGAQLTPFVPGVKESWMGLNAVGLGPSWEDSAEGGLREFGTALKDSGGNPLEFARQQDANFEERPMWQQIGAQAAYDPLNLAPGIGLADDAADLARLGTRVGGGLKTAAKAFDASTAGRFVAGEAGGASVTGVAKMVPGVMAVGEQLPEAGVRTGSLLNPRGIEQLGDYSVDDALKVARDLDRQRGSVANTLTAEADSSWRALGPTFKDESGNVYFKNIAPSEAEIRAGLPGASAPRVIERPNEYALTPAQRVAVEKVADIEKRVANERDLFGAPVDRMALDEGEQYMHRLAVKPSTATQVDALVNEGASTVSLAGGGGKRLGGGRDKSRLYDDVIEAIQDGVVYAHPKEALRQSIDAGLKKAGDAHVKGLLSPFAETASDRIPEALRAEVDKSKNIVQRLERRLATAEKRAGIKGGEGESLAKLFEVQATGAKMATDAPTADIQTINRFIQRAQKRITAIRQKGGTFEAQARTLSDMLDDARLRVADVMPAWEQAKELSRNVPLGRATVDQSLAPALIGSDFTKADAARIKAALSGGIRVGDKVMNTNIPGVKVLGSVLHPLNAIGDGSVTFNQLAMLGATHRTAFLKNFGIVGRDMVDDKHYFQWAGSPEVQEAAKYVTISGKAGGKQDLQFGGWVERIPGLKQTANHFTRFSNRMRVDAWKSIVDAQRRLTGTEPDALFKEQAGRAVDRAGGISASKATDAETLAQFAPNWMRSLIEQTAKGVADGTLEGQIARQYWKNYVGLGSAIVAGVAMYQNRDLGEVLTPLDQKALKRGEIRLNPNFMSVRVGGQDVSVFGAYDSLARLVTLGADSTYRSIRDRDAKQLFDFVGYAASTKGSALVKLAADVIKDETFGGGDPWSKEELGKRVLPYTGQNIVEGWQKGQNLGTMAKDSALGFFGLKSNPMSLGEKLNKAAGGEDFWSLPEEQRNAIFAANPELKAEQDAADKRRLDTATRKRDLDAERPIGFANLEEIDAERLDAERTAAEKFKRTRDPGAFREELDKIQADAASKRAQVDKDFQLFQQTGELPKEQDKADRVRYYQAFDAAKLDGVNLDHDVLDTELARLEKELGPERWEKIIAQTGKTEHAPEAQAIYDAKAVIKDKRYWELGDAVFERWTKAKGIETDASAGQYFNDIRAEVYQALLNRGMDEYEAQVVLPQAMDKVRKDYDEAVAAVRKAYREKDLELMRALVEAGYYEPGKEAAGIILGGQP